MVTSEIYEKVIREMGMRLAQAEIDRAFLTARLTTAVQALTEVTEMAETNGDGMDPVLRSRLQTLVVTLTG